jgi:hypothetical protein
MVYRIPTMRVRRVRCFECDSPAEHDHHVVPTSAGGTRTIPLCGACHAKAHGHDGFAASTSVLTRQGLARARAAGVRLGAPPASALVPESVARARELRASGLSLRAVVARLNAEGVPAGRGGKWWLRTLTSALK